MALPKYPNARLDLLYDIRLEVSRESPTFEEARFKEYLNGKKELRLMQFSLNGLSWVATDALRYGRKLTPEEEDRLWVKESTPQTNRIYPVTLIYDAAHARTVVHPDPSSEVNWTVFPPGMLERMLESVKKEFMIKMENVGLGPDRAKIYSQLLAYEATHSF